MSILREAIASRAAELGISPEGLKARLGFDALALDALTAEQARALAHVLKATASYWLSQAKGGAV